MTIGSYALVVAILANTLWVGAAVRTEETKSFLRATGTNEQIDRILEGGKGKDGESCPPGEPMYYNAFFTIHDDAGVTLACEEDEDGEEKFEEEMGKNIKYIVRDVDKDFPAYEFDLSSIETKVCIIPTFTVEDTELVAEHDRQLAKKRRKKTYTFSSSGRCRRCKKEPTERFLGDEEKAKEAAKEACDFAKLAEFALSASEEGHEAIEGFLDDIDVLLKELDDPKKAEKYREEVAKMLKEAISLLNDVIIQHQEAALACLDALDAAKEGDEKIAQKGAETAKKASQEAEKDAEKVQKVYGDAKLVKMEVEEEVIKAEQDERNKNMKSVIEEHKNELARGFGESEREEKRVQEMLKRKEELDEEETEKLKKELEALQEQSKANMATLEKKLAMFEEELKAEEEHLQEMDDFQLALGYADSLEEWMEHYKELLEKKIHWEFFNKDGDYFIECLDKSLKKELKVMVTFLPDQTKEGAAIEDCD